MFCFIQTFTLTSRSLHLPVGSQLISSISFEMFGCQPFFFQKPGTWFSPSSGLSDSTFPDFIFFSFLCQLTCQSADIMSSLCGVRVRVNNFFSKTTRPRDMLFFLKDTLSIEDEKLFKACKSVCSSVC